jgi:hypothetical protein
VALTRRTGRSIVAALVAVSLCLLSGCSSGHSSHPGTHPGTTSPSATSTAPPSGSTAPPPPPSRPVPSPQASPPAGSFNVVSYGADASGQKDSTLAIRAAVSAAEKTPGGTVYFPAGHFILDLNDGAHQDIDIASNPINIVGAGPGTTTLVEEIGAKTAGVATSKVIFEIQTGANGQPGGGDGTTITGMTLDSATYDAGTTILDYGNDTTLSHLTVLGARSNHAYNPDAFGVRVITICNHTDLATKDRGGNIVEDLTITGQGSAGNTDLDLSCQINDVVSNITDTGNGMDIYICNNVRLDNYTFTPGKVETSPHSYVITGPSNNISIENVTTFGSGGQLQPSPNGYLISNTTISNETMKDLNFNLEIGDTDSTKISDSTIGVLRIDPDNAAHGLTLVESTVGSVVCTKRGTITELVGLTCS